MRWDVGVNENDFKQSWEKNCEKNQTWGENYFLGKIMLEIILTKTKVVSTGSDNSRMKNLTFSIKNVIKKLSELTCATSALVLSVTWAGAKFFSGVAPVIKHEMKY